MPENKKTIKERESVSSIPNCWAFENCPKEICERCPAYPDMGKECWKVTGTVCNADFDEAKTNDC